MIEELRPWFEAFTQKICGVRQTKFVPAQECGLTVMHRELRMLLESDPVMSALLPSVSGYLTLGEHDCPIFVVKRNGLMILSPLLMGQPGALVVAARWAVEACHVMSKGEVTGGRLEALLRHGRALTLASEQAAQAFLAELLPAAVWDEFQDTGLANFSPSSRGWLSHLLEGVTASESTLTADTHALELPLECLLTSGGDNRLVVDPETGLNAYGVCPRPRPEAIHFSSSTASAVSSHGFLFADILRRELLDKVFAGDGEHLRTMAISAVADCFHEFMQMNCNEMDVAVCASGTDAEIIAVQMSLAGARELPLCNILVSPEESGRGVVMAGSGTYFDSLTATGNAVTKGGAVFGEKKVSIRKVAIRDDACRVLPVEMVDEAWRSEVDAAVQSGCHVLAHHLLGSKTGLSAPSYDVIDEMIKKWPGRIDVVVDACQLRSSWEEIASLVRRGWMVQISGSKFLTGPPFSGALLVPASYRDRADQVRSMLAQGFGVGGSEDWCDWWNKRLGLPRSPGSFGPIMRWLPALLEANLFIKLSEETIRRAFDCFRNAVLARFTESPWIQLIDDAIPGDSPDRARLSIIAFQVIAKMRDGSLQPLDEMDSQRFYRLLNQNICALLPHLSLAGQAAARLQCHIGQPVILLGRDSGLSYLRLVVGARFFNMIGFAGESAFEAALTAEVSDATRVLDKIELLASRWDDFQNHNVSRYEITWEI